MRGSILRVLVALVAAGCWSSAASASTITVGALFYTDLAPETTFDIFNLTGQTAVDLGYPITTPLTIGVTSLTVTVEGGGQFILPGSAFDTDSASGNVTCFAQGFPGAPDFGCNFAAYNVLSAVLLGTLSPTSSLVGLPVGSTGILSAFMATLAPTPDCEGGQFLVAGCDGVNIEATLVPSTAPAPVPEPSTVVMLQLGLGVWAGDRLRRNASVRRWFTRRAD